jgi:hypothetical protein
VRQPGKPRSSDEPSQEDKRAAKSGWSTRRGVGDRGGEVGMVGLGE